MEMQNNTTVTNEPDNMVNPLPAFTPPPPKPLFELGKSDTVFVIAAIIGCIFTSLFGLFSGYALGYALSILVMTVLFTVYLTRSGKGRIFPIICGILNLALGAVFVCTSNGSVRFFAVILSFLLALVCFDGIANGSAKGNRKTIGIFYSAASSLGNMGVGIKSIFSSKGNKRPIGKIFLGLTCALPVLLVVVPLLISSDDAFRGLMNSIFENTFSSIVKVIFGLTLALFVIPYGLSVKADRVAKIKKSKFKGIDNVYIISFLSAIVVCYLLYLFSQLAYFFSAFKGFLPDGDITYSEYARKGFFEMCTIAVINLIIVFTTWLLAKKQKGKICGGIKAMATFIAVFTLIIIATAISKMVLYIKTYGMTALRITTSAFMVFLAIVFVSIILKIFIRKINFVKTALLAAGLIVVIIGTANVNAVCAKYNYEGYIAGTLKYTNAEDFYKLGDEGIPYLVKLARSGYNEVSEKAEEYLAVAYMFDYFEDLEDLDFFTSDDLKQQKKDNGFDSFSIPRSIAYDALYQFIDENPGFCYTCIDYYEQNTGFFSGW